MDFMLNCGTGEADFMLNNRKGEARNSLAGCSVPWYKTITNQQPICDTLTKQVSHAMLAKLVLDLRNNPYAFLYSPATSFE